MKTWSFDQRSRYRCQEIVIRPAGRRRILYLVRCGARAPWMYRFTRTFMVHRCGAHKELNDRLAAAAADYMNKEIS